MTPSSAATDLAHLVEDLPLPREERLALDATLKLAASLRAPADGLADLDEAARKLAADYGAKFPSVGRKLAELRLKLLKAMAELRRATRP